jgi:hypothetical protein
MDLLESFSMSPGNFHEVTAQRSRDSRSVRGDMVILPKAIRLVRADFNLRGSECLENMAFIFAKVATS